MLVARVSALRTSENLLGSVVQPICIRRVSLLRSSCLRQYSQATSPIPPPLPSETTSQSSGLNHQLHPTGRPPLSPTSRSSSTSTAESIAQDESATTVSAETDSATASGVSSITGGYRTPLRVTNSNIPVSARDTVKVVYEAPLLKPVRGLKAFSISSLILSGALTPFILTLEAPIPPAARVSIVTAALGASILSTGLVHYFLSPYVVKATYMSLSHQLNLQTLSLFARRKNNVVNVDDLKRIDGERFRMIANLKDESTGKVWYVHPEMMISQEFWETLDRPRGGYKELRKGEGVRYKEKVGEGAEARMFEEPAPVEEEVEGKKQ